ncbi:MAG: hypothetical protein P4L53_15480 [Candidatus Obscuribacterales bacterium]|nr:hypothetical protein [Candidatus Obscuribacterales bacterium]
MAKFLISVLLATLFLANQAVIAKTSGSEWVLKQGSSDLGQQNVYVCEDAVKIESVRYGYHVLAKAPDWRVYCYRPGEKKMWVTPLNDFSGILLINPFAISKYTPGTLNTAGAVTYAGLKCQQFRPLTAKLFVIFATDEISTNPKICEFINRYYYLQNSGRVPLFKNIEHVVNNRKLNHNWLTSDVSADLRKDPRVVLETLEAKKVPYRSVDFEIPQNYTIVNSVNDISLSKSSKATLNDLVDSLGFTSDFDQAAKPKH